MDPLKLFIASIQLFLLAPGWCAGGPEISSDRYALLAFKASISSDPQASLGSWSLSDVSPCGWEGIRCDHQRRVVGLSLPDKSLVGSIPRDLQALTQLQRINLRNNSLSGSLPPEIARIQNLHKIILSGNRLSGGLPEALTQLPSLEYLDVSSNLLQGSIPHGFTRLQHLNLSHNSLSGAIPQDLTLQQNASLDLSHNELTGVIPRGIRGAPPAAFSGNPQLCGAPLQTPCGVAPVNSPPRGSPPGVGTFSFPKVRNTTGSSSPSRGLSVKEILAIAVGDAVGIVLLGLVFIYCFRRNKLGEYLKRRRRRKSSKRAGAESEDEERDPGNGPGCCLLQILCCCSDAAFGGGDDSNLEGELVLLEADRNATGSIPKFDLEDLLRASAYVLGKGAAGGIVYKAVLDSGVTLAVRRLPGEPSPHRRHSTKAFESAVQIIGRIRHPCIVPLRAYYCGPDEKLLVYDYIANGTLASALHGQSAPYGSLTALTWAERVKISRRVAEGICHIHECGPRRYIHGDLRSKNILLGSNMDAFVADLGLNKLIMVSGSPTYSRSGSRNANTSASLASQVVVQGSGLGLNPGVSAAVMEEENELREQRIEMEAYRPPEAKQGSSKPSQKWDVYAFGVVLLELISGRSATQHLKKQHQQQQKQKKSGAQQQQQQQQQQQNGEGDERLKTLPLVEWAQKMWEGKRPVYELLDPMLMHGIAPQQKDVAEFLKISLSCVSMAPEQRPKMKHVCESLKKLGS